MLFSPLVHLCRHSKFEMAKAINTLFSFSSRHFFLEMEMCKTKTTIIDGKCVFVVHCFRREEMIVFAFGHSNRRAGSEFSFFCFEYFLQTFVVVHSSPSASYRRLLSILPISKFVLKTVIRLFACPKTNQQSDRQHTQPGAFSNDHSCCDHSSSTPSRIANTNQSNQFDRSTHFGLVTVCTRKNLLVCTVLRWYWEIFLCLFSFTDTLEAKVFLLFSCSLSQTSMLIYEFFFVETNPKHEQESASWQGVAS